jgi:hypothetical protein
VGSLHVVQDVVEEVGPTRLPVLAGVVTLAKEDRPETASRSEVGAVLADGFE